MSAPTSGIGHINMDDGVGKVPADTFSHARRVFLIVGA